jgi:sulfite exporter TauE/SafE
MLANCLHDLAALGPGGLGPILVAMLVAGLAGGATHCAGMCAPFILAQVNANGVYHGGTMLARISGSALLSYHAGRMLGYSTLGALAGGGLGALSQVTGVRYLLGVMLLLAAALMVRQALGRLPRSWLPTFSYPTRSRRLGYVPGSDSHLEFSHSPLRIGAASAGLLRRAYRRIAVARPPQAAVLMKLAGKLIGRPTGWNGVGLGLLLSGLPCGLLYAALAAAAATGSALAGALSMLAFTLGTVPSLFGVALLGRFFLRGGGGGLRIAGGMLFLLNGGVLAAIAWRLVA